MGIEVPIELAHTPVQAARSFPAPWSLAPPLQPHISPQFQPPPPCRSGRCFSPHRRGRSIATGGRPNERPTTAPPGGKASTVGSRRVACLPVSSSHLPACLPALPAAGHCSTRATLAASRSGCGRPCRAGPVIGRSTDDGAAPAGELPIRLWPAVSGGAGYWTLDR